MSFFTMDWITFSPRTKSVLLLVATLLLGVVLGVVLNAWLVDQRLERMEALQSAGHAQRMLTRAIGPTSDAQAEQVAEVLGAWLPRVAEQRRAHRRAVRALIDSLRADLRPLLSEDQQRRLSRRLQARRSARQPPARPSPPPRRTP
ncbi:MAG: hypothetical protein GVY15_04600 [Bacteroidetes bacterium]|jgi:hypothetical protein|nr:hypothetical protein [Bacteroidota bacterium]